MPSRAISLVNRTLHSSWFCFPLVLALTLAFAWTMDFTHSLGADSFHKLVQAYSLKQSGPAFEEIYRPLPQIDPESRLGAAAVVRADGKLVSPFPVALAVIQAPFVDPARPWLLLVPPLVGLAGLFFIMRGAEAGPPALLFAALTTPLLFDMTGFPDVFFAMVLAAPAAMVFHRPDGRIATPLATALAGLLLGLGTFFRLETTVFAVSLIVAHLLIRPRNEWRTGLAFALAFGLGFAAFALFNWLRYDHPLGPRFLANPEIVHSGLGDRLARIRTLLIAGNHRTGYFSFTPVFAPILAIAFLFASLRLTATALTLFLAVAAVASPNDSNIDWGTRYFALSLLPMSLLTVGLMRELWHTRYRAAIALIVLLSIPSVRTNIQLARSMGQASAFARVIQQAVFDEPADLYVFRERMIVGSLGWEYLTHSVALADSSEKMDFLLGHLGDLPGVKTVAYVESQGLYDTRAFPELKSLQASSSTTNDLRARLRTAMILDRTVQKGPFSVSLFRIPAK